MKIHTRSKTRSVRRKREGRERGRKKKGKTDELQLQLRAVKCGIGESRRKKVEPVLVPRRYYETILKRAIS